VKAFLVGGRPELISARFCADTIFDFFNGIDPKATFHSTLLSSPDAAIHATVETCTKLRATQAYRDTDMDKREKPAYED
jgi:hypothetical protein